MGIYPKKDEVKNLISYTPTPEQHEELNFVYDRWQKMKNKRSIEEKEWIRDEDQYMMQGASRAAGEWRADLKLPDTTGAILAAQSEEIDQTPGITYIARNPSDQERAAKFDAAFKYSWEKGQGNLELADFLLQRKVFGSAIGKEYWCTERIQEKEVSEWELDADGNQSYVPKKWEKKTRLIYDDVKFRSIYIKNFWIDESATNMENAIDCVELELLDEKAFHDNFDDLYDDAKLVKGAGTYAFDWYTRDEMEDKIEVICYYNKVRDMFAICANGILLTKPENPNPYKHKELPYVRSTYLPRIKSFYGIGLPRLVRSLQEEKNTIRNMRLDVTKLNIGQIVIVDDKLELSDEDLEVKPRQILKGPPGSIQVVSGPQVNPSSYQEEALLKEDIIRATGVDPRLQTEGGKGDTATEISILKESSMKRIRLTLRYLEWEALYRLGRLRLSNFAQFYKIPKFNDIIDDEGEITQDATYPTIAMEKNGNTEYFSFSPEDTKGEYDIIVAPGSTLPISKALEAQKRINLFDRLKGHPDVNQRRLAEELIRAHDLPVSDLMAQQGEPPMGASPVRGQEGVDPMAGGGQSGMQSGIKPQDVLPAQLVGGVNTNA